MSFAAPLVLLALIGVPVLLALYVAEQRRRRQAAAAFVAPTLAPSVAPDRPGWRRHWPMVAFALAIVLVVVAAARPQHTVSVPIERASIMLMTDVSSSMAATDVAPSRLAAARKAGQQFVNSSPKQVNIGVLAFNETPTLLQQPTRDRPAVRAAIAKMHAAGHTATGSAIATATAILNGAPSLGGIDGAKKPPAAIVLLSDGKSTSGIDPVTAARTAGKKKIPIYTIALGTAEGTVQVPRASGQGTRTEHVPPDPAAMAQIAKVSGGQTFAAADASKLTQVYKTLGSQLGHQNEQRELLAWFVGGAILLLLIGSGLTLRWFGRLI